MPNPGRGWLYYPATAAELRACIAGKSPERNAKPKPVPANMCSQQGQILGLCKGA